MMTPRGKDANPPRWAEPLLRLVLSPANRDTITGDLLEEYREVISPTRGPLGARWWYLKHALSLAVMSNSPAQWAIWLIAAGAIVVAFLMRYQVGPPFPAGGWAALAILASATLFIRPVDLRLLWAASLAFGLAFAAAAVVLSVVTALIAPILGQHSVFAEYSVNGGRLILLYCAAVFITAGFYGTWRGHRVGTGILVAVGSGIVGATSWLGLAGLSQFFPALAHELGPISTVGSPVHLLNNHLMLVTFSIAPGVVGAALGKGLGTVLSRRGTSIHESC